MKRRRRRKSEIRRGYMRSKVYKVKLDIYKQRRRYKPRVKNKDKKRWIKLNKNLKKDRRKKRK